MKTKLFLAGGWLGLIFNTVAFAALPAFNDLLPKSPKIEVQLYDVAAKSPETNAAMQTLSDYLKKYPERARRNAEPGQPLPYDPDMGISKQAYEAFLKGLDSQMGLKPMGKGTLTVTRENGKVILQIAQAKAAATIVEFAPDTKCGSKGLELSFQRNPLHSQSPVLGTLNGYSWKDEAVASMSQLTGKLVKLTLAKIEGTPECVFHLECKDVKEGQIVRRENVITKFPCK